MNLVTWAAKWGVPAAALADLTAELGLLGTPGDEPYRGKKSEAFAQSQVVLEGAEKGVRLFRNNVGALRDEGGRMVRYGLANSSKAENEVLKSADLIGWRMVRIEQRHVGSRIAQFVSREIKEPGWQYVGDEHEQAQLAWAELVAADGGDAAFATGPGTL